MSSILYGLVIIVMLSSVDGNIQLNSFDPSFGKAVQPQSVGSPWPMPQVITTTPVTCKLTDQSSFRFYQKTAVSCPVLAQALVRYKEIVFSQLPKPLAKQSEKKQEVTDEAPLPLTGLAVSITDCSELYPSLESLENYTLEVGGNDAVLTAHSAWGALRGLETFSQIVYQSAGSLVVNKTSIVDFPRFAHRGYLVDSSRHFLPVGKLLQFLDAMAYNKMNVFHWHIVDDQSFPYESTTFPYMSEKGAFMSSYVYSQQDVLNVINYARDRGIRVIPEFDTPGHTQSWGSVPNLLTPCADKTGKPTGSYGPVNPMLNSTYDFLAKFFKEIASVFPDQYIHLGGDEVNFACWKSNKDIQAFMTQMGYGQNYSQLEGYYEQRFLDIVEGLKVQPLVWQEVVDNGVKVDSGTVVHVWKTPWQSELFNVTKKGYKSLISTPWYLNLAGASPYNQDWRSIYSVEPLKFNGTQAQKDLVFGGEACMWGEYVDATNLMQRSWPRGCAVAERLWSAETVHDVGKAAPRIAEQRCRMLKRGLQAEPVTGPGFCDVPLGP
ncbi:beta-hexosaminidase subunit alpha-like isoform X1 [Asterias amurensis]|uniref:beta-hexosaminidase subunit alpha-like isoform X1 n=1 Tax=Asterias amurensis TaxID=7602 RepID=UPI003AB554EA